jgi:anti-sigma B factor antagonist
MDLTVRVRPGNHGTVVQVGGDLDIESDESFQQILLHIMRSYSPRLLLDLAGVSFMDCAGVRALVMTRRRAEMRKGSLRLVAASMKVRRVITITGMKDIFPVTGSGGMVSIADPSGFRLMADLGTVYP